MHILLYSVVCTHADGKHKQRGKSRVENSRYMGSASTGLYPALVDGQFMVPGDHAPKHMSRTRKDLDRNLTREEKVRAVQQTDGIQCCTIGDSMTEETIVLRFGLLGFTGKMNRRMQPT